MAITQANGVCPAILVGIEEILSPNGPGTMITPLAVQALRDPENLRGVTVEQLGGGDQGHIKPVRIKYKQRALATEVTNAKNCISGVEKPMFEDVFNVGQHKQHAIKVSEATIRALCDTYSSLVRLNGSIDRGNAANTDGLMLMRDIVEELMADFDPIRQAINDSFLTAVALKIGTYQGGATTKNFNVIKAADNALVLTGFNLLKQEMKKIGMNGAPIVFGGGNIDLAMMAADYGCCNAAGQDFGVMKNQGAGFKFYEDYNDYTTLLGNANAFVSFFPKTIQMAVFNKYVGSFAKPIGSMERGTIPDPALPGVKYDIRILPNECGEYYDLFVNIDYDFWFAPTNQFKAGDRLAGVNGIFKGVATAS